MGTFDSLETGSTVAVAGRKLLDCVASLAVVAGPDDGETDDAKTAEAADDDTLEETILLLAAGAAPESLARRSAQTQKGSIAECMIDDSGESSSTDIAFYTIVGGRFK